MYTCRHSVFFAPWLALFAVPVILWTSYALSRADSAHLQGPRWASPSSTHAVAMAGPATRFVCLSDTHGIHTQKGLLKVRSSGSVHTRHLGLDNLCTKEHRCSLQSKAVATAAQVQGYHAQ